MHCRRGCGFTDQDLFDTKVYLRSITDAANCLDDTRSREVAAVHYKMNLKQLSQALQESQLVLDKDGELVAGNHTEAILSYRLMRFSKDIVNRYGLAAESIKDPKDLDNRLDRAIKGLETEIGLKQGNCQRLLDQIREHESKV